MIVNKTIKIKCTKKTKQMIKERARKLDMSVSDFLKYLALKDIEESERLKQM